MNLARILSHLFTPAWVVNRKFPAATIKAIEDAIRKSETTHSGEVRFAVEGNLDFWPLIQGESARERAMEVFSNLRIWDTERNNGVLIYLLLADRDVEIIADRGIHAKVGAEGWETICKAMEQRFREGRFEEGVLYGINSISEILAREYPSSGGNLNELPDRPVTL